MQNTGVKESIRALIRDCNIPLDKVGGLNRKRIVARLEQLLIDIDERYDCDTCKPLELSDDEKRDIDEVTSVLLEIPSSAARVFCGIARSLALHSVKG